MGSYSTVDELGRRVRDNVDATMFRGEQFLGGIDTWHLFRFLYTEILVLTDQRIILYRKGLIRESTRDFDRDQITNVRFDKGMFRRKLSINGSSFSKTWRVPYRGGQEFAAAIRAPEPQPVYGESSRSATPDTQINDDISADEGTPAGSSENVPSGIDAATITKPGVERFGFDRWHLVTAAALVLAWLTVAADVPPLPQVLFVVTGVAMYIDILVMREASTWDPRAWLYAIGWFFGGIGAAVYLFNRYRVMSNTDSSTTTVETE